MKYPKKCVVDANVPITANRSLDSTATIPKELIPCVRACVEAIEYVKNNSALVVDSAGEILAEYRNHLAFSGQPGPGDAFLKWIYLHIGRVDSVQKVIITKGNGSYLEFPNNAKLTAFDPADRKYVAVAAAYDKAHEDCGILQGTDSKWWGWKDALKDEGIDVVFLCPDFVAAKYNKKMK